jgi:hypothetical protein
MRFLIYTYCSVVLVLSLMGIAKSLASTPRAPFMNDCYSNGYCVMCSGCGAGGVCSQSRCCGSNCACPKFTINGKSCKSCEFCKGGIGIGFDCSNEICGEEVGITCDGEIIAGEPCEGSTKAYSPWSADSSVTRPSVLIALLATLSVLFA